MIDAISAAISQTPGCSLLDVDPGASTNRTVYTFVGPPEAVVEGALSAARQAFSLIDMSKHSGESEAQTEPNAQHKPLLKLQFFLRGAPTDRRAGRLSLYPRPKCQHGRLCLLCQ